MDKEDEFWREFIKETEKNKRKERNKKKEENEKLKVIYNFLKEYEALCKKYDLEIGACGCCDSPFIEIDCTLYAFNIKYCKEQKCIFIDGKTIDEHLKKMEEKLC